jgi:D-alanyl-D-alanine carboxypeptidase
MRLSGRGLHPAVIVSGLGLSTSASATPTLLIEAASGEILYQDQATKSWYPASLTKLMTVYVALNAVQERRLSLDTPLVVSARAARMAPSKMGFNVGTEVTLGNALKMLMVKSANDIAVTIAEGVSGSVEAFADEMNAAAASLGMTQSRYINPNGLPDERQVTSARDLAILARALYLSYPDHADLYAIGALQLGESVIPTHNGLIGRYPGADGMKTGFTCPAGFNLVASANRGGRRLIAVILGAPSANQRTDKAAALFDRGFAGIGGSGSSLRSLPASGLASAPDMRTTICRNRKKAVDEFEAEIDNLAKPVAGLNASNASLLFNASSLSQPMAPALSRVALLPRPEFQPVPIYVGRAPGYIGPVAQARPAHSPVGAPPLPETATSYAEKTEGADGPLKADVAALPLKAAARKAKLEAAKAAAAQKAEDAKSKGAKSKQAKLTDNGDGDKSEAKTKAVTAKPVSKKAPLKTEAKAKSGADKTIATKTVAAKAPEKPAKATDKASAAAQAKPSNKTAAKTSAKSTARAGDKADTEE